MRRTGLHSKQPFDTTEPIRKDGDLPRLFPPAPRLSSAEGCHSSQESSNYVKSRTSTSSSCLDLQKCAIEKF